jgi:hypothetical protein
VVVLVFASGSDSQAAIAISNAANSCALVTANKQPKNARPIAIGLATRCNGLGPDSATGACV